MNSPTKMDIQRKNSIQNINNIITGRPVEFPYTKGMGQVLFEKLKQAKDKVAQIDGITGERDTYESFTKRCIRTAIKMRSKGIKSDDIITVCTNNHLNTCTPLVASFFLDVTYANTDPNLSLAETRFLLKQAQPKMIFVSVNAVKLIEDAIEEIGLCPEIVVFGETNKHTPFSEFIIESVDEATFKPVNVEDLNKTCAIFFSSGSSGMPKGICLNHKTLLSKEVIMEKDFGKPYAVILSTSPPYWISQILLLRYSIVHHSCRVMVSDMTVDTMWQLIDDYKVSMILISPFRIAMMCQSSKQSIDRDISSLRLLSFGGTTFPKQLMEEARELLPNVLVLAGYGMTEVGGAIANFCINDEYGVTLARQKPTSSGQPAPGTSLKIVDIETEEILGPNQKGEIRIKTDYQMNGYHNKDASDQWDKDGFIKSGDLGYFDEDCYFYVTDRIKEMLKYQSWHISPVITEGILMKHPAVRTAVVIGVPHPIDNEHSMGLVILNKSCDVSVTAEEIEKYVNDRVDNVYKLRAGIKMVNHLPKTPSEKYKRKYIRDLVLAGKL